MGLDLGQIIREKTQNLNDVNLITLGDLKEKVLHRIVN
jgi:hypothetical protein